MMKKSTVAAAMLFVLCANVNAAEVNQGNGTVNFVGAIIDAPCSIAPESAAQTLSLGQVANASLDVYGESLPVDFDIKLEGCTFNTAKTVDVTFNGIGAQKNELLAIQGPSVSGAAIEIRNKKDNAKIVLGTASKFDMLTDGSNTLRFNAKLVKTAVEEEKVTPGEFTAQAEFQLNYQ